MDGVLVHRRACRRHGAARGLRLAPPRRLRLHLLVAPVIIGSGKSGLSLPPIDRLADALRPTTRVHILADGDVLFDCDLRSQGTRALEEG